MTACEAITVAAGASATNGYNPHAAQTRIGGEAVVGNEADGVPWVERRQHRRILPDVVHPHGAEGKKPQDADRPEERAHDRRAVTLESEQRYQHEYSHRKD